MANQQVTVRIYKKGDCKMTIDCHNFLGEQCSEIEALEQQLGEVTKHEDKDERMYQLPNPLPVGTSG